MIIILHFIVYVLSDIICRDYKIKWIYLKSCSYSPQAPPCSLLSLDGVIPIEVTIGCIDHSSVFDEEIIM